VSSEGLDAAKRFYDFWTVICPILLPGNFLYCSGRSAYLYALGKGLYHSHGFVSPGKNKCLLLDTLKENHIQGIFNKFLKIEDSETIKYLASLLYQRTNGVLWFIAYGVNWLLKKNFDSKTKMKDID
jgi:hypothetical protein